MRIVKTYLERTGFTICWLVSETEKGNYELIPLKTSRMGLIFLPTKGTKLLTVAHQKKARATFLRMIARYGATKQVLVAVGLAHKTRQKGQGGAVTVAGESRDDTVDRSAVKKKRAAKNKKTLMQRLTGREETDGDSGSNASSV